MTLRNEIETVISAYNDAFLEAYRSADPRVLLPHYRAPVVWASGAGVLALPTADDVVEWLQGLHDGLREGDYDHSEYEVDAVEELNPATAAVDLTFRRLTANGIELGRQHVRYQMVKEDGRWLISGGAALE